MRAINAQYPMVFIAFINPADKWCLSSLFFTKRNRLNEGSRISDPMLFPFRFMERRTEMMKVAIIPTKKREKQNATALFKGSASWKNVLLM